MKVGQMRVTESPNRMDRALNTGAFVENACEKMEIEIVFTDAEIVFTNYQVCMGSIFRNFQPAQKMAKIAYNCFEVMLLPILSEIKVSFSDNVLTASKLPFLERNG